MTCEDCWKAFEAGYKEAEDAYALGNWPKSRSQFALEDALRETRQQLERDFAIRCRCDFVTKLFAGIERCVGCRARDRIYGIDAVLAAESEVQE